MKALDRISLIICVASIILGVAVAFALIWLPTVNSDATWKALASLGTLFVASSAAAAVSRTTSHTDKDQ